MRTRPTALVRLCATALAVVFAVAVATPALAAPSAGTGGWYWPTGTESFKDWSGWWDARGGSWHLAQDMHYAAGRPVYAVAAGTVLESKYVRGYGPGGSKGGAVVILHKTYDGREFKALYGHLSKLKYEKGDKVKAGAVIGVVNGSSPNHLHFGIHPGRKYPSDNNPYRGHTYTKSNDYGFVDPVKYLKATYRLDPYRAPALATLASVRTTATPLWTRARGATLYWAVPAASTPQTYTFCLPSGPARCADASANVPPHDSARYVLSVAKTTPSITVRDRLPRVSLKASDRTPAPGTSAKLYGSVKNSAGKPFVHARVRIERWDGGRWVHVTSRYTSPTGWWSLRYTPTGRTTLRARFVPPKTYSTGLSATLRIMPDSRDSLPD